MKIMLNSILNFLLLLCLVACSSGTNIAPLLSEAEEYMNEKPDSALFLLESITYPKDLTQEQNALWCLLITQARDKEFVKHTSDSLINIAVDYFNKTDDVDRKAQSYYCQGRALTDMLLFDRAIVSYLKAEELVQQTTNYNLQARICNQLGDLYRENLLYNDALYYYQKANYSYKLDNSLLGEAYTLRDIGLAYESKEQLDSAAYYLNASLIISEREDWSDLSRTVLVSLGSVYESLFLYEDAIKSLNKSIQITHDESSLYSSYCILASLYGKVNLTDSAFYYLDKASSSPDLYVQCQVSHENSNLLYKQGDYKGAFEYNNRYILLRDSIENLYQPKKLAEIEAGYNYEKLINEKNQLILKKKETKLLFSSLAIVLLLLLIVVIIQYQKKLRQKLLIIKERERDLSVSQSQIEISKALLNGKENELKLKIKELEENEAAIQSLILAKKQLEESLIQKSKDLNEEIVALQIEINERDSLYENKLQELQLKKIELEDNKAKIELLKIEKTQLENVYSKEAEAIKMQIITLKDEIKGKESVIKNVKNQYKMFLLKYLEVNCPQMVKLFDRREVVSKFSDKEWSIFEDLFNSLYPKFVKMLCKKYPKMNKKEQRYCCLLLLGVKTEKISMILDLRPNTISKYPNNIHDKYFVANGKESLKEILLSMA